MLGSVVSDADPGTARTKETNMARAYEADEKIQAYYYAHPDDTPTIHELMDACNISSSSVVAAAQERLARRQVLAMYVAGRTARRYRLATKSERNTNTALHENKRLRDIITRAASYLPGNPDQAERILSEIR